MTYNGVAPGAGELVFPAPRLSFACELDPARLVELFADAAVIDDLLALDARVALMCSDFSDERAGVVRAAERRRRTGDRDPAAAAGRRLLLHR